jgi:DNA-binding transcriptional LysR family regulator
VSSIAGLQSLVEQGLGVTAMPALAALPMTRAALVFRPLAPAVHRVVYLAVRPGRSPTPAASVVVVAALLERLEGLSGRDIEVLAHAAGLAEIGFGAAEPARRRRVTGQP